MHGGVRVKINLFLLAAFLVVASLLIAMFLKGERGDLGVRHSPTTNLIQEYQFPFVFSQVSTGNSDTRFIKEIPIYFIINKEKKEKLCNTISSLQV